MVDRTGVKVIELYLQGMLIELSEMEFLMFAGFIIRCRKEIEWLDYKGISKSTFVFSRDVSLVYIKVDSFITITYRYNDYSMSRQDFENYIEYMYESLKNYKCIRGLDYRTLDPVYLEYMLAVDLPYLTDTYLEKKYLKELKIFVKSGVYSDIADSKHFKMVKSGVVPNIKTYTNLTCQTHEERVKLLCNRFSCDDYGSMDRYIILYNNTDIIRDGAHRAAILYANDVEKPIVVRRMMFSKNYYTFDRFWAENQCVPQFESLLQNTQNTRWLMVKGKRSRILRSDSLKLINQGDIEILKRNGISTCIDLTTKLYQANTEQLCMNFEYYNIPISYLNSVLDVDCSDYYLSSDYYMYILSQKEQIKDIFNILKCSKGASIIYCAIGRDRTGVICILIQMLLGCTKDEIIEEYSLTDLIYEKKPIGVEKGFSRENARKYIIKFLQKFYEIYRSIEEYLFQTGLNQNDIDVIRKRLTDEQI